MFKLISWTGWTREDWLDFLEKITLGLWGGLLAFAILAQFIL